MPNENAIYIFLCSKDTRDEVLRKHLVGTTWDEWNENMSSISHGSRLLIYDYERFEFIGPFEVLEHNGGRPLDRDAFGRNFHCQARFREAGKQQVHSLTKVQQSLRLTTFMRASSDKPKSIIRGEPAHILGSLFSFRVWDQEQPGAATPLPAPPLNTEDRHEEAQYVPPPEPIEPSKQGVCGRATTDTSHARQELRWDQLRPLIDESQPEARRPAPQEPRREQSQSTTFKTKQGFVVASKAECRIADYLADWRIDCYYDNPIPGAQGYRYDFYLPKHDVYIEYWGLIGDPDYDQRRAIKARAYHRLGMRLISLVPDDEADLEASLRSELQRFGIPVGCLSHHTLLRRFLIWIKRWLSPT